MTVEVFMEQFVVGNLPEETPMSVLLAADTGHDIAFEPERLGLTARASELGP